jgi:hypothetical protein
LRHHQPAAGLLAELDCRSDEQGQSRPKYTTRIGKDGSLYRMSSNGGVQVYRPGGTTPPTSNNIPQIGDWNKSGDEYLNSIPETQRSIVQQLVNGQLPLSQYKLNDPNILALAAAARTLRPVVQPCHVRGSRCGHEGLGHGRQERRHREVPQSVHRPLERAA